MIDTHAHLDFEQFDEDRKDVIERFFVDNGKAIVNIGVDKKRNKKTLNIAENNTNIFAVLGFHPETEEDISLKEIEDFLIENCKNSKVKAIGEVGLDYFHCKKPREREFQKKLFTRQLQVAKKIDFPVVIHCRDAYEDLLEIISSDQFREMKMVMHCFCGGLKQTEKFLKFPNLNFSFTGNLTFLKEKDELLKVVEKIPLEKIMVETDCPFLAPVPNRGRRNEPRYVRYVIEKIAEIKGLKSKKIENQTDKNAIEFFELKMETAP
jgi:TatD DNase family protein